MIYATGDTHGHIDIRKLTVKNFPAQEYMTKDDLLIIAGDFGLVWNNSKEENYWLDWLEDKNFTTLFVDGNHENYSLLNSYETKDWMGGQVHEIRPSVKHLMRGEVFELQGKKFFTFGGARSHDKEHRIAWQSWWPQEEPNYTEINHGICQLEKHNNKVDYVITHTGPSSIVDDIFEGLGPRSSDPTEKVLEEFKKTVTFNQWIFGHLHKNIISEDKRFILLYDVIYRLE